MICRLACLPVLHMSKRALYIEVGACAGRLLAAITFKQKYQVSWRVRKKAPPAIKLRKLTGEFMFVTQMNAGFEADCDVGPMISPEAKARCERLIQAGIDQGATCDLDGRGVKVWRT